MTTGRSVGGALTDRPVAKRELPDAPPAGAGREEATARAFEGRCSEHLLSNFNLDLVHLLAERSSPQRARSLGAATPSSGGSVTVRPAE